MNCVNLLIVMVQLYLRGYSMSLVQGTSLKTTSFLSATLKQERKKANMTQSELAKATGLGLKTIRKIEQGDQSVVMSKVNLLLNFFGLELGPHKLVTSPVKKVRKNLDRDGVLQILKGVLPIFKSKYGITKLGLFGSFARGENGDFSDIDIIFEGASDFSGEGQMTLILEHLFGGYKVDFTHKDHIDPRLLPSILEEIIYV